MDGKDDGVLEDRVAVPGSASHNAEHVRAILRGQADWATWGSATDHRRYVSPIGSRSRRRCGCGCGRRATHQGSANGVALVLGCELAMRRWAKNGTVPGDSDNAQRQAATVLVSERGSRTVEPNPRHPAESR